MTYGALETPIFFTFLPFTQFNIDILCFRIYSFCICTTLQINFALKRNVNFASHRAFKCCLFDSDLLPSGGDCMQMWQLFSLKAQKCQIYLIYLVIDRFVIFFFLEIRVKTSITTWNHNHEAWDKLSSTRAALFRQTHPQSHQLNSHQFHTSDNGASLTDS